MHVVEPLALVGLPVVSVICLSVCLFVRTIKGKQYKIVNTKLVEV